MGKNQKIIAVIVVVLAGATLITNALIGFISQKNELSTNSPPIVCPIELVDDVATVNYHGVAGETALATLQELCAVQLHPTYDGFVTGIAGYSAGDTHYWAFYINEAYATEGAGTYIAQEGDEIKWVLTSLDDAF